MIWPTDYLGKVVQGGCLDVLRSMPDESVNCCITSPPYWGLRDYGVTGQLGLEKTPEEYVAKLVEIFREVRRVLRNDGTLWLNLGDSYIGGGRGGLGQCGGGSMESNRYENGQRIGLPTGKIDGLKPKDLVGIPWRVAFALQADGCADIKTVKVIDRVRAELYNEYEDDIPDKVISVLDRLNEEYVEAKGDSWYLRQDIIWHKPNPMPESVTDRCTKAHEYIFLLSKKAKYYYDAESIREEIKPTTNGTASVRPSGDTKTRDKEHWGVPHEGRGNVMRTYGEIKGANRRSVWTVTTKPFREAHFATFPPDLIEPCALAGCPESGIILDPFMGAGTTAVVAKKNHRQFIGVELNPAYIEMAVKRIDATLVNRKLQFEAKP